MYLIMLGVALYFAFAFHRNVSHLYVNQYVGNRYVNGLFYYVTYLGDGGLAAFILLFILILNVRAGIACTSSFLAATAISNALKYTLFDDVNRPHYIFQYIDKFNLRVVEGVDLHIHNSFPSGHATQAFAILLCLAFIVKPGWAKLTLLALAVLTSFSRVYLSQHFLADITAGSIIGSFCAVVFYLAFIGRGRLANLDKPLTRIMK
jgi:membrane-associated phospholipid phosphatase